MVNIGTVYMLLGPDNESARKGKMWDLQTGKWHTAQEKQIVWK